MKNYFTPEDDKLKWSEGQPETLLKTVVCNVTSRHNVSREGVEGDYIIMDAPDWAIVIAEKDDKFLMVKQWRHGEAALSIEFPGGVIDKGESPEEAARRELEEETGCKAAKASASPPTRMESVAFFAPTSPPVTGASNAWMPLSLAAAKIFSARIGDDVVISTT